MESIAMLEQQTYVIEYNPNCHKPYLVRLVAPGTGYIDKLPPRKTKDILGYGRTLKEAASRAFRRLGRSQEKI